MQSFIYILVGRQGGLFASHVYGPFAHHSSALILASQCWDDATKEANPYHLAELIVQIRSMTPDEAKQTSATETVLDPFAVAS